MNIILFLGFFVSVHTQDCSVQPFPSVLPLTQAETQLINLNRYFSGPSITFSLKQQQQGITLQSKYQRFRMNHNLGQILSIKHANSLITMLGLTSLGQYYIYYSQSQQPQKLRGYKLPKSLTHCTDLALSPDADQVAVTCLSKDKHAIGKFNFSSEQWQIAQNQKYEVASDRKIGYLGQDRLSVIYSHTVNSYVELWNMKYFFLIGIYDRVFLNLPTLQIVDAKVEANYVYILDYETGLYRLKLYIDQFFIDDQVQLQYYTKFAIFNLNELVIARQGGLAELTRKGTMIKYEVFRPDKVHYVIMGELYIVVYSESGISIYMRGSIEPYLIFPFIGFNCQGVFMSRTEVAHYIQKKQETKVQLQILGLNQPILNVTSLQSLNNKSISVVSNQYDNCNITFQVKIVSIDDYPIFQNTFSITDVEFIYMNQPGNLNHHLAKYAVGPNLMYEASIINNTLNISLEVEKINELENSFEVSMEKVTKVDYTEDGNMVLSQAGKKKYVKCELTNKIMKCAQKYEEQVRIPYHIYELATIDGSSYEFIVNSLSRNEVLIRKLGSSAPQTVNRITIENNTYGQHNITFIHINQEIIYIVTAFSKQIHLYTLEEDEPILITTINKQKMKDVYFHPQKLLVDVRDRIWIQQFNSILVIKMKAKEPQLLSSIQISEQIAYTFEYVYSLVNYEFFVLTEYRASAFYCAIPFPLPSSLTFNSFSCKKLPRYDMILLQSDNRIDRLGKYQIGIPFFDPIRFKGYYSIYNLDQLGTTTFYYGEIEFITETKYALFRQNEEKLNFLQISSLRNQTSAQTIYLEPSLKISIPSNSSQQQATSKFILFHIYNKKNSLSHSATVYIANYPQDLTKGENFPHTRMPIYQNDVNYTFYTKNTTGWLRGNVLQYGYGCNDCGEQIEVKGKLWMMDQAAILGGFNLIILSKNEAGVIRNNMLYVVNLKTGELGKVYQLTESKEDIIEEIDVNNQLQLAIVLVRKFDGNIDLVIYSLSSQKGFPIFTFNLPKIYILNMDYEGNVIAITTLDSIYLLILSPTGQVVLGDIVSREEAGGDICWGELFHDDKSYSMIVTVCESGIFYINFEVGQKYRHLLVINRQKLDLVGNLKQNKINIPNGAYFKRTSTSRQGSQMKMLMLVNYFNSLQWVLQVDLDSIVKITLTSIFQRCSDLTALTHMERTDDFTLITYFGQYQGDLVFINAIYDNHDYFFNHDSPLKNYYIMESFVKETRLHGKFLQSDLLLGFENSTALGIYNISNAFRALFKDTSELRSQTIFMNPIAQKTSRDNPIGIKFSFVGIEEGSNFWTAVFIVLGIIIGILFGILVYFLGRRKYNEKKLVRLIVDQEIEDEEQGQKGINESLRGSEERN